MTSRKNLKRITYSFAAVGLAFVAWVFLQTFSPTEQAIINRPYFEVSLNDIVAGDAQRFEWHGRPFYILHRSLEQIDSLLLVRESLRDPDSLLVPFVDKSLDQPGRSITPDFFVASVLTSHSPCGVQFIPKSKTITWATPWYGGFFEPCKGAAYDVAGRVYSSSTKDAKNLTVIPHSIIGAKLRVYADLI